MGYHTYRVNQPRTQPGSLRNEIIAAMENDKRKPRLETIGDNHFVISVGTGQRAAFYKVPYEINEYGVLNLDFTREVKINEAQGNELLTQAATKAVEYLNNKGGNTMTKELLGPPGINKEENNTDEKDLERMQEQAEQQGKLLPAHLNRSDKKSAQQDDSEILPPPGVK